MLGVLGCLSRRGLAHAFTRRSQSDRGAQQNQRPPALRPPPSSTPSARARSRVRHPRGGARAASLALATGRAGHAWWSVGWIWAAPCNNRAVRSSSSLFFFAASPAAASSAARRAAALARGRDRAENRIERAAEEALCRGRRLRGGGEGRGSRAVGPQSRACVGAATTTRHDDPPPLALPLPLPLLARRLHFNEVRAPPHVNTPPPARRSSRPTRGKKDTHPPRAPPHPPAAWRRR